MKRLLSLAPLALLATPLLAQEQTPPSGSQGIAPRIESVTELQKLLAVYRTTQGGDAVLGGLRDLSFRLVPLRVKGEQEIEEPSLLVDIQYGVEERRVRVEEDIDGKHLVKLSDGLTARVWVDGELVQVPELSAGAREEALLFFAYFDLLYGLEAPDLAHRFEGVKTRDGQPYLALRSEFHASRQVYSAFRLYFHPDTALVERMDVFDLRTLKRLYTIRIGGYRDLDGLKVPGRMEFVDLEGKLLKVWRLEDVARNRGLGPERFREL